MVSRASRTGRTAAPRTPGTAAPRAERRRLAAAAFRDIALAEREMPKTWLSVVSGIDAVRQFEDLRLPCSVVSAHNRYNWFKIWHSNRDVTTHELLHGREAERSAYTHRLLERAYRSKRPVLGTFGGFCDWFIPIVVGKDVTGFLVSGPFSAEPWSARRIRDRFQKLTSRPARPGDPELFAYAQTVLATPVLSNAARNAVRGVLTALARILSDPTHTAAARARWQRLCERDLHRYCHDSMWSLASRFVDPVEHSAWSARHREWDRAFMGLRHVPNVVVALSPVPTHRTDPLEALVDEEAFVNAASEVALDISDALCGRAGGSVVYYLCHVDRSSATPKSSLLALADRICVGLRRAGHSGVRVGVSTLAPAPSALARCLGESLRALGWAIHKNETRVLYQEQRAEQSRRGPIRFRALDDLCRALEVDRAPAVSAAIESLIGDIVWCSAGNVATARAYANAFYSRALQALDELGVLEPRALTDDLDAFQQAIDRVPSVNPLIDVFRRHLLGLERARKNPKTVPRDARLDRALAYVDRHLGNGVSVHQAASIAGYAPRHFARLLHARTGKSFEQYVLALRVDRAQSLLTSTDLSITEIGTAIGFRSTSYFFRAFRRLTGKTPAAQRRAITARLWNKSPRKPKPKSRSRRGPRATPS